mgnify:CR=1 FL=1
MDPRPDKLERDEDRWSLARLEEEREGEGGSGLRGTVAFEVELEEVEESAGD